MSKPVVNRVRLLYVHFVCNGTGVSCQGGSVQSSVSPLPPDNKNECYSKLCPAKWQQVFKSYCPMTL